MYLGTEYFQWFYTKKLAEYYHIIKQGLKSVSDYLHEHLVICPMRDKIISIPSTELYRKAVQGKENMVYIENATHSVFYDKDPAAEEKAVGAELAFATKHPN